MTILSLGHNSLSGTMPTELGKLDSIQSISVFNNTLTGVLPSELGLVMNLTRIFLGDNDLTGAIPNEIVAAGVYVNTVPSKIVTDEEWSFCSQKSFDPRVNSSIECANFCGTIDEECNSVNIRSFECSDVGCSGDGFPSCTVNCRLDYSTCSAGPNEHSIQFDLETGSKGWETHWELNGISGLMWQSEGSYRNYDKIREYHCVARGCYTFVLMDSGEDGICCSDDENGAVGEYTLLIDGVVFENSDASFEESIVHEVGYCTSSPTITGWTQYPSYIPSISQQPTTSPSLIPSHEPSTYPTSFSSLVPSVLPSTSPSISPSHYPSSKPAQSPSQIPSSLPSRRPSHNPSSIPSQSPSFLSSQVPSKSPSFLPSESPSLTPSMHPSVISSSFPSQNPSVSLSALPSQYPSALPSITSVPSQSPSRDIIKWFYSPDPIANEEFGYEIALTEDFVYIGSPNGNAGKGAVYVFNHMAEYIMMCEASDGSPGDRFGHALKINDNTMIVGAPSAGAVYLFSLDGTEIIKIQPNDSSNAKQDQFGYSVDLNLNLNSIVVGAPFANGEAGAYYLFGAFTYEEMLKIDSLDVNGRFGSLLCIFGERVYVSAPRFDNSRGAVYMYSMFLGSLIASVFGESEGDEFGTSIEVGDGAVGKLIIGAPKRDAQGVDSGIVYLYNLVGNPQLASDVSLFKILSPPSSFVSDGSNFGISLHAENNVIYIAAIDGGNGSGTAFLYGAGQGIFFSLLPLDETSAEDGFGHDLIVSNEYKLGLAALLNHGYDGKMSVGAVIAYYFE